MPWKKIQLAMAMVMGALACAVGAVPAAAQSLPETVEAIQKARVSTRILFITAHPDDEWSSLLTYLSRGLDADVGLLTITRGQGGQNAIGPEQGDQLGVIRTEELLAAGKIYGVQQFFTRAPDFGYSKSADQTMKIWDNIALEDMVRVIRTFRPQVVINGWGGVHGGHGQHQASGILTPEAIAAAANPKMFPEQLAEGLPAWRVGRVVRFARNGATNAIELPTNDVSPLWGKSYTEMGMEGHAQHRSQGTPAFFGNAFFRRPIYLVPENEKGETSGTFDRKLLAEPISTLAAAFPAYQSVMAPALASADEQLAAAEKSASGMDRAGAAKSLAQAGTTIVSLREQISKQGGNEAGDALWELDQAREKIDRALTDDVALPVRAQAARNELVAGETFSVSVDFLGKPAVPVKWDIPEPGLQLPQGWSAKKDKSDEASSTYTVTIPGDAVPPASPGYAILPFPPPLVEVPVHVNADGYTFTMREPVQCTRATTTGIATYSLELVPAVTLTVEPREAMVPVERSSEAIKLLARVRYHGTRAEKVSVGLDAPHGWSAEPIAPLEFSNAGDQLVRFVVTPPARPAPGAYDLKPYAKIGEKVFRTSLEPIPTLVTREWSEATNATVHVMDLVVPAHLRVGYIAADNDPLPERLREIGIQVELLDEVALSFDDLSRYDAIVVGIRAYELRPDLVRSNSRLLKYVSGGGSLVVQYQRDFAWNDVSLAPYPAKMPEDTSRVTDANSPVRFLAPQNPLLNTPNKILPADFDGWVQERGLYFWTTFDSHYQAVLGLKDPGESEVNGALVYAKYGNGVYIYTGLSFFRELPAGVPGAYRLFVNLLSQTQHTVSSD